MSKPLSEKRLANLETSNECRRSLDDGEPVGLDQTECRELIAEVRRLQAQLAERDRTIDNLVGQLMEARSDD